MFPNSVRNAADGMNQAIHAVESMSADMGGT